MSSIPEIVDILERRRKLRFKCDYPARIRGHDVNGKSFVNSRPMYTSHSRLDVYHQKECGGGYV